MKLSVIICTRNRAHALTHCLDATLQALAIAGVEAECLVVDNGSSDNTQAVVTKYAASHPQVRLVSEQRKGLSYARNAGINAAQGELIAFTDDDCQPEPNYFATLLHYAAADTGPVLRGARVELGDTTDQPFSILTRTTSERWQKNAYPVADRQLAGAIIGASMLMPLALAKAIGPFDVRFGAGGPFMGGEEIDYIYRVYEAGYLIEYVPDAVIRHYHGRKTLAEIGKLVRDYDVGDGALYAKYMFKQPQLLRPLWWDFKKALKELRGGPLCRPALGLSHWSRLYNVMRGIAKYAFNKSA